MTTMPNAHEQTFASVWQRDRAALCASAVLFLLGGALCLLGMPMWWFGSAIAISAAVVLARLLSVPLRDLHARAAAPRRVLGIEILPTRAGLEACYLLLIAFVGTVMMWEIMGGERPVSHDHTVHYVKAWQLHRHFLPEGRLFGWSPRFFAGYPVNYLYPPGTDLWVNAVHLACLGLLSFSQSYAVAFWLFHLFTGYAGYRFGRALRSPHLGLLVAMLMLTDLSEFRLGGWAYTVEYGVWPQALSLNFGLLAVCHISPLVERQRLASIGWFALFTGLSIITHPAALIFLVLLLVIVPLSAAFADDVRAPSALLRLLVASLLSVGVAAIWLFPFLSSRAETYVMGVWWDTTYQIGKGLLDLEALPGTLPQVLAFGCLALAVMLRTRRFLLLFCALMALFVPVVSNSTFVDEFHLPSLSASFTKIQFLRMSTMVKPFWFALAGYFALAVVRHGKALVGEPPAAVGQARAESHVRAGMLALVVALLTVPFVVPAAEAFWTRHVRRSLTTESDRQLLEDRRAMVRWLEQNLPEGDGFYRIGVFTGHNHDLLDLAALLDKPFYKRGFTPATNFIYKMKDQDRSILEAVNLRFVLSKKHEPAELFELVQSFGTYKVYRFRYWDPKPFSVIEGDGDVQLERFSDEEIVLRAAPGARGRLRLNVSYFSRWQAYLDGKPVPISLTYLNEARDETGFITVRLRPGRYRFVFERSAGDLAGLLIGLGSLLLALAFIVADRRPRGASWLSWLSWLSRLVGSVSDRVDGLAGAPTRRLRLVALFCFAGVLLLVAGLLAEWRPPIDLSEQEDIPARGIRRVRYDFLEQLSTAFANIEYREANQPCLRIGGRLVCRDATGHLDNDRFVGSTPTNIEEYKMVRCIRARPEADALLSISFPDVPMGDAIVGYFGVERAGRLMNSRRPVELSVMVDQLTLYTGRTESDNRTHYFQVPLDKVERDRASVVFSVRARNVSKRYFCFYGQVVDFR